MIGLIVAGTAAVGGLYAATKGVPIRSGIYGDPRSGTRWRIRWALWRWKAEAWNLREGWVTVGEYKTEQLAKNAAQARAQVTGQRLLGRAAGVASGLPGRATSFQKGDV